MTTQVSPLGKTLSSMGVDALLAAADEQATTPIITIPLACISTSHTLQPRREFDEERIQDLATSIKEHGVLQPILVRPVGIDQYEIIAGERRFQACQFAKLHEVPCIVRDVSDSQGIAIAIVENLQREALNPIEAAEALSKLIDRYAHTHVSLAKVIGKSRAQVSNLIRLLNLEPKVKEMVFARKLDMGHARALLSCSHDMQFRLAQTIVNNRLSVRATEKLVQSHQKQSSLPVKQQKSVPNLASPLQETFPKAAVKLNQNGKSGHLKIPFTSQEELNAIIQLLKKS